MVVSDVVMARAREWLSYEYDPQVREAVQWLIDNDPKGLNESFGGELEFGTGGLRALVGVGTNRLNIYTVHRATQGLANYLGRVYAEANEIRVAIAYDSRNNSLQFAEAAAGTLSANRIRTYLYDSLRPTPQLSYTVRALKCHAGIVITASHNPKEYNGYKVYWGDGGQVVSPHDRNIIEEVGRITSFEQVKHKGDKRLIVHIGEEMDEAYLNAVLSTALRPSCVRQNADLSIVYTPIHGAGSALVPEVLKRSGFNVVQVVSKQREPDGNFSTVSSPNPEDPKAMEMALQLARDVEADLVLGTDPDADRMGVYTRTGFGQMMRLDGNQIAVLLAYYVLNSMAARGDLPPDGYIVRSVVTSPLLDQIAADFSVKSHLVLTGFKYIAAHIERCMGNGTFLLGAEESHGYLVGDGVRDKDAVQACMLFAEFAAWCKSERTTPFEVLESIYRKYGLYAEAQRSVTLVGEEGRAAIVQRMRDLRKSPPREVGGERVVKVVDFQLSMERDLVTGREAQIDFPPSDVLQLFLEAGTVLTIRPSGTEPKIKYYCSIRESYDAGASSIIRGKQHLERMLDAIAG